MIPLETKVMTSENKIIEWYNHFNGNVYISFSGGKDSTVLLHLVRSIYPDVPAVFCDTGLEYPEIKFFVKSIDNVEWLKPKVRFDDVIKTYGFPIISKEYSKKLRELKTMNLSQRYIDKTLNTYGGGKSGVLPKKWHFLIDAPFKISEQCCDIMKKNPFKLYEKLTGRMPYIGSMAVESSLRKQSWKRYGCNAFEHKRPQSRPLMPWTEEDIQDYIKEFNIKISDIYSMGYKRTGCMFCGFGSHLKNDNRFELLKDTHPNQYKYIMEVLGFEYVLNYIKSGGMV